MAAWAAALAGFVLMSVLAGTHETFPADVWLAHRIQDVDGSVIPRSLDWAEDAVDLPLVVPVTLTAAALLLLARDRPGALIIVAAAAGRPLTTWALKELIERPRPSAGLLEFESQPSSSSFPSGHAEGAIFIYGLIFYFAGLHIRTFWLRVAVQAACVAVIAGTGVERVYAGHHWPSDVLGGLWVGALILAALIAAHQAFVQRGGRVTPPPASSFSPATPTAARGSGTRET